MDLLKVSPEYDTIEEEFEASLKRAFVDGKADYIVCWNKRQRFLLESASYGLSRGWLSGGEFIELDEQSSEIRYRLTDEGRKHFGIGEVK